MLSVSFFSVMSMMKTSSTMLKRSGGREHPCTVPNLSRKALICSLSSMILDEDFLVTCQMPSTYYFCEPLR